ncbi:MAG: hypothetical protein WC043_09225 [Pseudobdellovibrionaceae bacterium]
MIRLNVTPIFQRFAGQEIKVTDDPYEDEGKTYHRYTIDPEDTVYRDMQQVAQEHNFRLVVMHEGVMGLPAFRPGRVTAYLDKTDQETWVVRNEFSYG